MRVYWSKLNRDNIILNKINQTEQWIKKQVVEFTSTCLFIASLICLLIRTWWAIDYLVGYLIKVRGDFTNEQSLQLM